MSLNIYTEFNEITGYNVRKYLEDFYNFTLTMYQDIINYYNGADIVQGSFNEFERLKEQSRVIEELMQQYSNDFKSAEYWVLYDKFSSTQIKLDTIENMSRWMRSSRTSRYDSKVNIAYVMKQNESIERISKKAGNTSYEDEWYKLAIDNDMHEEAYTSQGGNIMTVKLSNNLNFNLRNVVDNLTAENIYGKDINKKISFESNDVICLQGMDSLMQTFETIFLTFKGSIPEFPEDGLSNFVVGSNVNVIGYQYIFRNIMQMFQKDDRFKSIELINLSRNDDQIFLKLQAKTKINDFIPKDIVL